MNREQNKYKNEISGEVLNATEMFQYVVSEAERQFEELNCPPWEPEPKYFNNLSIDEQQECILEQFEHQLKDRDWKVI
jgi:hypothetical protein